MNKKNLRFTSGLAALAAAGLLALSASAQESFNLTNVINQGVNITSWPGNPVSTNLVITSYTTNGAVITTNGFYPGVLTGGALSVRSYDSVGFVYHGLVVATNTGNLVFTLVRAITSGSPAIASTNTVYPSVKYNDWDNVQTWTLSVPYAAGTNYLTWTTNLDHYLVGPASHLGIYNATNSGPPGTTSTNNYAGLLKKVVPFQLSSGNWP